MKPRLLSTARLSFLLATSIAALLAAPAAQAADYYWDTDGSGTPGFGTASGIWGTSAFWGTDAAGSGATANTTITTADTVHFGTGTAGGGLAAGTVGVTGTVNVNKITFGSLSGAIVLSGGSQITLGGTSPTITVNNTQDTISTKIAGTAGLIKAGTGELVLNGTGNSFSGGANGVGIHLFAGTLTVSGGSTAVTGAGNAIGTFSAESGNFNQTGTSTVTAAGDLIVGWNSFSTFTLSGGTTSAANIRHQDAGAGVVTISGTNSTTATTVLNNTNGGGTDSLTVNLNTGGTLTTSRMYVNAGTAVTGSHALNINLNGGTLKASATGNLIDNPTGTNAANASVNATVKLSGANFDSNGFAATILRPLLHDSGLGATLDGGLTLNDTAATKGSLVLTGANTYTGATTISAGTLRFTKQVSLYNNSTASWTAANIKVANTGTLALNVGGTGEFTTGDVTTLLTNLGGLGGTVNNDGLQSGSTIGFDTTNAGGTFTIVDTITNSTGTGGGAIGLTKLGTGTLTLSNANTYTGVTTIRGGTLSVATLANGLSASDIGAASNAAANLVLNGGTLQYTGNDVSIDRGFTVGTLTGTVNVSTSGQTLTTSGSVTTGNGTLGGGLVVNGPGTLSLTGTVDLNNTGNALSILGGNVTTSGTVTNTTGNIVWQGTSSLTVAGGTFTANKITAMGNSAAPGSTLTIAGGTFNQSAGSFLFGQTTGGNSTINLNSGTFQTSVGFLGMTATGNALNFNGGTFKLGATIATLFNQPTRVTLTVNSGGAVIDLNTFSVPITNALLAGTGSGGLTLNSSGGGGGTLTLSGANTYTGATTVNAGTLALGASNVLPDSSAISLGAATLAIGAGFTDTAGTLNVTAPGTINLGDSTSALAFADSNGTWSGTLNITGTFVSGLSLRFGTNASGLSGTQLSQISGVGTVTLDSNGYLISAGGGNTYADWLAANAPATGFGTDTDNDGISNGVENVLGSNPNTFNPGLTEVSSTANSVVFKHTLNPTIASDVTYSYEWSTDLVEWKASGQTNTGGTTATITPSAPVSGVVTVTITITGGPSTKLFGRLVAVK